MTSSLLPSPNTPPIERLLDLLRSVAARPSKRDFLGAVDALRDDFYAAFEVAYGDTYYAKLLYLKTTNFLIAGYHFACGHTSLASRPLTLMVDPSNSCQLRCPACVHSDTQRSAGILLWPNGVLSPSSFERLLARYGPFATNSVLYNYGEPLLNKKLPSLIRLARSYGMTTNLSTNLSIEFDVREFVAAQPDHIILSIDGITQESYGRFRKGGDLELVLSNVRKIVEAKEELGTNRPILAWRFFPFEHNVHEVEDAIALAESMGVDQMIIGSPFDVSGDDPGVRLVECPQQGQYDFRSEADLKRSQHLFPDASLQQRDAVERFFEEGWLAALSNADLDEPVRKSKNACPWLHYNMTLDAVGRVMPCCMSPAKTKDLVFTNLDADEDWWNGQRFADSRLAVANRRAYKSARRALGKDAPSETFCRRCSNRPEMTYAPPNAWMDLNSLDFKHIALNPDELEWWRFAGADV